MVSSYWEMRRKQEQEWSNQNLASDQQFSEHLQAFYDQAVEDINQTISQEISRVGANSVSKMDVQKYETKAKAIVAEADEMRKKGHKVTYADFSAKVNQRLKVYNATMRINRLEHLKSEVGLDMLRAGLKVDSALRDKLSGDYQKEAMRQAGIMMDSAQRSVWTSKEMGTTVMKSVGGATFSDRLWANQDALKARLDQVLATGLIAGQSTQKMAQRLRDQVKTAVDGQRFVTERLARTESARIQNEVQLDRIKKHGFKYVQWIAEVRACPECQRIERANSGYGPGVYTLDKVPYIPVHPNCRCGISETWLDDKDDNWTQQKAVSKNLAKAISKSVPEKKTEQKEFNKLMQQELAKLTEEEIRRIGREVYPKLAKQGIANGNKFSQLGANFAKFNEDYRRRKFASYADYREAWDENVKAIQEVSNAQAEMVADVIKEYREVGSVDLKFQPRSSVPLRKLIKIAYDHYPTDWSREAEARNTLKVRQVGRGYYDDRNATIAADKNNWSAQTTMYHELGHRQESVNKEIVRLENEFYERRTEGEREQKLSVLTGNSNYASYETAKPDNFKSVYMGKRYIDYSTQEPSNFELLSTGLEGIYQARYNIWEDQDMAEFILGLLLKG